MRSLFLGGALVAACSPQPTPDTAPTAAVDTAARGDTGVSASEPEPEPEPNTDTEDDGLFGVPPDPAIPLPVFAATNRDGSPRGPEHLTGDPAILWFFRDAGSAG